MFWFLQNCVKYFDAKLKKKDKKLIKRIYKIQGEQKKPGLSMF